MKPITLITGGTGFIGFHLCERLVAAGEEILWLDNFYTDNKDNIRMRIPPRRLLKSSMRLKFRAVINTGR